jgi:carbamoyltransferase
MNTTYILGVNCAYHESSACILRDGELVAVVEEERFSRIKHAKSSKPHNADKLPQQAIAFCLKQAGLDSLNQVQYIGYSFEPQSRLNQNNNYISPYPIPTNDFGTQEGEQLFYAANLRVESQLRDMGFTGEFYYLDHHDCHAASCFFVSQYDAAAVLVIDGIGEFESTTYYIGQDNRLQQIGQLEFPNSIGLLWEKISLYLGFSVYDASKVMGLSSYGNPQTFQQEIKQILTIHDDGTFSVKDEIVQMRNGNCSPLQTIFGLTPRTEPVTEITPQTQGYADVAVALQIATEEIFIRLAKKLRQQTGLKHLCMAGGVALNCVANGYLSYAKVFENFYVQPAANDAGTAIGAAYLIWHHQLKQPRLPVSKSPYLGPEYSDLEIEAILQQHGLIYEHRDDIEAITAQLLTQGHVISWFQGRMELGPRALGNRSLLADPRHEAIVPLMNVKVKHRERFRPFCPSVLAERAYEWFELPRPLPEIADYMLGAFKVLPDKKHLIPAVVHFDGTCRIQTVHQETNPRYHCLLSELEKLTGIPIVLNTSFNDREPIVCSPQDAVHTFLKTEIDYLAIGNFLLAKQAQTSVSSREN